MSAPKTRGTPEELPAPFSWCQTSPQRPVESAGPFGRQRADEVFVNAAALHSAA